MNRLPQVGDLPLEEAEAEEAFGAILDGATDKWAESSLYMVGDLEEARTRETQAPSAPAEAGAAA